MKNTVNIPSSVKDINISISRKITILAEQQAVLTKTQLHVDATRQQILELRQARKVAILDDEARQAQAFVASVAPLRENFLNGLFD